VSGETDETDEGAMRLALDLAQLAGTEGEVPVGAVVVIDGRVVGRGRNQRHTLHDPTAHAEILALREASATVGRWRLTDATMYCTLEPCPMCAGALVMARVGRLVFGASDPKAGACGSRYNLCADPRLNHELAVTPDVLAEPAAALLRDFFERRRAPAD
jgi:tRNA(adenine34) deaminase